MNDDISPKHYLGLICGAGHNWNNTGYSLRYKINRYCTDCQKAKRLKNRKRPLPVKPIDFSDRYFLGLLCRYKHEYENTGRSLRYKSNGNCLECTILQGKNRNPTKREGRYLGRLCKRGHNYQETRKSLRYKDGACIECEKEKSRSKKQHEYDRVWRERNRENTRAYHRQWEANNPDKVRAYYQQKIANPGYRIKATIRIQSWHQNNLQHSRESSRVRALRRQARLQGNHSHHYTAAQVRERYQDFDGQCAYCGSKACTLDHVIPVSKGGPNVLGNLLPCCKSCNPSKHNREVWEWYSSQPFYSSSRWQRILRVLGKKPGQEGQLPLF